MGLWLHRSLEVVEAGLYKAKRLMRPARTFLEVLRAYTFRRLQVGGHPSGVSGGGGGTNNCGKIYPSQEHLPERR